MENQQTLNDFPTIDVWVNTDGSPLIKMDYSYQFQGKTLSYDSDYIFKGLFVYHFKNYTKSINIKKIGQDIVNQENINLVVVGCPDFNNVVDALEHITSEVYHWCRSNNVRIVVCLTREAISTFSSQQLHTVIQNSLINRGFDSSVVKIVYNAYDFCDNIMYADYLIPIDTMRRTLKFMVAGTINDPDNIKLSKDRSYNFSLLTGTLYNRWSRVVFLAKCHDLNLLNDKFFYSIYMIDKKRDLNYIAHENAVHYIKNATNDPKLVDEVKAAKKIFQHRTFDKNGNLITGRDMYQTMEEYFIPPQVLDSYVHIVLETGSYAPSLTEKIFKPIVAGLPFIWHGYQNILPYLESLGFKRYNYIDYSFDSDPDPVERMNLLIKEVQRLNKTDLRMLAYTNRKISKHNQEVFKSICKDYNDLWCHLE